MFCSERHEFEAMMENWLSLFCRKHCIELEQQFDFLKDLVATVPDMQGEGEENHTEGGGEKVPRRYSPHTCLNAAAGF